MRFLFQNFKPISFYGVRHVTGSGENVDPTEFHRHMLAESYFF